jgi:hypothetical protein
MQHIIEPVLMKFTDLPKLDASGKPIINGMNGVLDMSRPIGKVLKSKRISVQTLGDFRKRKLIPTTDSEQLTGVDFAVRILEKKIAYLESVDAKMFYLNIGC